jgi:hypothetical protein
MSSIRYSTGVFQLFVTEPIFLIGLGGCVKMTWIALVTRCRGEIGAFDEQGLWE